MYKYLNCDWKVQTLEPEVGANLPGRGGDGDLERFIKKMDEKTGLNYINSFIFIQTAILGRSSHTKMGDFLEILHAVSFAHSSTGCNIFLMLHLWCHALSATSRRLATAVAHLLYSVMGGLEFSEQRMNV